MSAAQIAADPDDYCTIATCPLTLANFTYIPSLAGNVTYLAIFALLLIPQLFLGIRHKTWVRLGPLFVCIECLAKSTKGLPGGYGRRPGARDHRICRQDPIALQPVPI